MKRTLSTEVLPAVFLVAAFPVVLWSLELLRALWADLARALQ